MFISWMGTRGLYLRLGQKVSSEDWGKKFQKVCKYDRGKMFVASIWSKDLQIGVSRGVYSGLGQDEDT